MDDFTCRDHVIHSDILSAVNARMPDDDTLSDMASFFKVCGDFTRVRILCALFEHEMCVCDIAELLSMNQSAISHQLRILKQAALVKNRRDGKTIYYSLADDHIKTIFNCALEHVEE